jgi:hypothetical protein
MTYATRIAIAILLAIAPLGQALAQAADTQPASGSDPCQAAPGKDPSAPRKETTDTLSRCGGVLKPPASADEEIAKPPPQQGDTPVIHPEQLPPKQQPQQSQ